MLFSSKRATFSESRPATCWLTQDRRTSCTHYYTLCMTEHRCDLVATRALHVHKV
uniref:Cxpwmw06 n=1 Tax=Periplaneta americana TaxID=6978 RepID=Q1PS48_PERAM|nr:cxpwmw06 [Periplaneta americana]